MQAEILQSVDLADVESALRSCLLKLQFADATLAPLAKGEAAAAMYLHTMRACFPMIYMLDLRWLQGAPSRWWHTQQTETACQQMPGWRVSLGHRSPAMAGILPASCPSSLRKPARGRSKYSCMQNIEAAHMCVWERSTGNVNGVQGFVEACLG